MTKVRELFGAKKEWSVGPGANLRGANFRSVDLRGADLRGADLTDAIFNEADLTGACLDRAILRDSVLFRAILTRVSAVGADFRGAVLRESELHGADLADAIIDDGECEAAYGDSSTRLPSGRSVNLANRPDDPFLGVSTWGGGYRLLRRELDDDAPGQPLITDGMSLAGEISEVLRGDLMASLARVLDEAIQLSAGVISRVDDDGDLPSGISWYGSDCTEGRGSPHEFSGLADFLVRHLDVTLEAVHSDGSIGAIFRPAEDVVDSLTRHVLTAEYDSFFSEEEDETEITEVDVTISSHDQFLSKFEDFFDRGFDSATSYRFFVRPSKRKLHIATVECESVGTLRIEIAKSQFGQEIAESLWSEYEGIGDDPKDISVADLGWTLEVDLKSDETSGVETHLLDEGILREVRELYKPVAISHCGTIVGFETWEDGLVMSKIALTNDAAIEASVVGPALTDREVLQALIDEAISAYVFTRMLGDSDLSDDDDSNEQEMADSAEMAEDDEEFEDESEEDDESDDDIENNSEDAANYDDAVRLAEIIGNPGATRPAVARIWGTPELEYLSGGVLDVEIFEVSDSRWKYMLEAAKRGELYLRTCDGLMRALGILELTRLDGHTFKVRMKPCAERRFHLSYEWIPPSSWRARAPEDIDDE